MQKVIDRLGIVRTVLIVIAVLLIAVSWFMVGRMYAGLEVRRFTQDDVPLLFMAPEGASGVPGVIIAHGFGGSQQLMLGYGLSFARAGYGVLLLNFSGHASNPASLSTSRSTLQDDMDTAFEAITAQPEIDPDQIALLGHSMGSGAVMNAGIVDPDRYAAVIAVSPTGAEVTASVPPNLLLQAGELEGRFVENARGLLEDAGGENDDFSGRRARRFVEIPGVEHITILFSAESREAAASWLSDAFGVERPLDYRDTRMAWLGLHLLGWMLLVFAAAPLVRLESHEPSEKPGALWRWTAFTLAPVIATLAMIPLGNLDGFSTLLGMHVGGALALWILMMGALWLGIGVRPSPPRWASLLWGLVLFAVIWIALGLISQYTWMQWFLIPRRLVLWPLLALVCLPWKLAMGHLFHRTKGWWKLGLWLLQSAIAVAALMMVGMWVPGMYVVVLFAPVMPIILGVEFLLSKPFRDPWVFGIGNALFFGWLIATFFPLA